MQCKKCFWSSKIDSELYCTACNLAYCKLLNKDNKCREYYKKTWFYNHLAILFYIFAGLTSVVSLIWTKGIDLRKGNIELSEFLLCAGILSVVWITVYILVYTIYKQTDKEEKDYVNSVKK